MVSIWPQNFELDKKCISKSINDHTLISYLTLQLEDCALQIYRYHNGTQGDYGNYLDMESTLDEQPEELEGFQDQ